VIAFALGCCAVSALVMLALWARQLRTRNANAVDVAWSVLLAGASCAAAIHADGDATRRVLVGALASAWGLRLAWHLWRDRVQSGVPEDGRYRALRAHWGKSAPLGFLGVYLAQAVVVALFAVPIHVASSGGALDAWAAAGAALWLVSVAGETIADRQLADFRADPRQRGQVCRVGLWRYSRHPNYFFEWLHWFSYVLIARGAALSWIGPALMLLLLLRVSGIPWAEAQALRSRGERYREYQRTTSAFVPWPPREGARR